MKKLILIYGLVGGFLIVALKFIQYRFLIESHSTEVYGGFIAAIFASIGIWLGVKLTKTKETVVTKEVPASALVPFALNHSKVNELRITKRELEILELIARGMSNREIAEKLLLVRILLRPTPAVCLIS